MTDDSLEKNLSETNKKNRPLTGMQKLMFGMICWGVHTMSQVRSFETNGFDRKYLEAKKAIRIGMTVYAVLITIFVILAILFKKN
ncbi:MAG: hypothetical protein MUQ68_02845 [Crocinitomicaceae bacterium]|nr:hypothetical protein [Crocinitomicaceae bacterium]